MKRVFLGLALTIGILVTSTADASTAAISGDYCQDQAFEALKQFYGEQVIIKNIYVDSSGEGVHYWMKTNLCESYIVASFVKNASCRTPHIGEIPNYMRRIWAHGESCLKALPNEIF